MGLNCTAHQITKKMATIHSCLCQESLQNIKESNLILLLQNKIADVNVNQTMNLNECIVMDLFLTESRIIN